MMMSPPSVDGTSNMDASGRTGIRAFRQCEIQALSGPDPSQQCGGPRNGLYEFQRVGPVHAADFCGRVIAMWLRIRRW